MPLARPLSESAVVITGASGGIGAATAEELARHGTAVVLAARRVDALESVATRCRELGGQALVVPTDVTDVNAVERLAQRAMDEFGHLDAWVNNAAVGLYAPLPEAPLDDVRRVIETNLLGCLYGMRAALPRMRESGGGVLVNNASVLAVISLPYLGAYNMAKHGVLGLSDALRQDLRAADETTISVCTCMPATIDTPFYRHAANYTGRVLQPPPPLYPPSVVARSIVRLIRRPRRQAYAGGAARVMAAQWRLLPGLTERALSWYSERAQFGKEGAADSGGNLFRPSADSVAVDGGWHGRRRITIRRAALAAAVGAAAAMAVARRVTEHGR